MKTVNFDFYFGLTEKQQDSIIYFNKYFIPHKTHKLSDLKNLRCLMWFKYLRIEKSN